MDTNTALTIGQLIFVGVGLLAEIALLLVIVAMPLLIVLAIYKAIKSLIKESKRNDRDGDA